MISAIRHYKPPIFSLGIYDECVLKYPVARLNMMIPYGMSYDAT